SVESQPIPHCNTYLSAYAPAGEMAGRPEGGVPKRLFRRLASWPGFRTPALRGKNFFVKAKAGEKLLQKAEKSNVDCI
ncbi:hypothetical protein, partial [Mesorhizobium sp.]|uniref:hypothetical protein n=1 Tax=Mesorhizobium sp. TaxID=1871066 RepID=UPI0025FCDC43